MKFSNKNLFILLFCIKVGIVLGQSPDLGSAAGFSVFTGVGAFTVSGTSTVTGDVGTNAGAFIGFPPGILFGEKYIEDAVSQKASVDVELLYNDLFSRTCESVIDVSMGNGQTLTPGIYCTGAATTLSGNLILDGLNKPDALFIIQINGALASNANTTVTLTNGASSCNVFWQINGMLTLDGITLFKGTAVVQGAVSLLDKAMVEGRILVTKGAINMASNIVLPCEIALPVKLSSFDVSMNLDKKSVSINWQTSSELNSSHFIIEKSADGITFNELVKISAIGNSQSLTNYSFIDLMPLKGINYYRLKQCDADGTFVYSNPAIIEFDSIFMELKVFPNPMSTSINIQLITDIDTNGLIFELFGSDGKMVRSVKLTFPFSEIKISDLKSGQYFYVLKNAATIFKKGMLLAT